MVYDEASKTLLLYAGPAEGAYFYNTWGLEGQVWQLKSESGPILIDAVVAYHAATKTTILYGFGQDDRNTWTWNGTTWVEATGSGVADGPAAYDGARRLTVSFGGNFFPSDDTWTWDGKVWTRRNPRVRPPGRRGAAIVYDERAAQTIVFGGQQRYLVLP